MNEELSLKGEGRIANPHPIVRHRVKQCLIGGITRGQRPSRDEPRRTVDTNHTSYLYTGTQDPKRQKQKEGKQVESREIHYRHENVKARERILLSERAR